MAVYMRLNLETELTRSTQSWLSPAELGTKAKEAGWSFTGHRPLYGKTVGLLGYGHIARETARLFKAFNCRVIAATSNGSRRPATGVSSEGCTRWTYAECSTRSRDWETLRVGAMLLAGC